MENIRVKDLNLYVEQNKLDFGKCKKTELIEKIRNDILEYCELEWLVFVCLQIILI